MADSPALGILTNIRIDHVQHTGRAIRVVAVVVEQIAEDRTFTLCDDARERGICAEAISYVGISIEPEVGSIAEVTQIVSEFFR